MSIDLSEDPVGRSSAFATACAATYVFVRNIVMKPAIKSCHQQIADLREMLDEYREFRRTDQARISQLETVLLSCGIPQLRAAMQGALSEVRADVDRAKGGNA